MKRIEWTENAWSDYVFWQENDSSVIDRINLLIKECLRSPFEGIGKPEPLKGELAGFWSRRLTGEHRFIYAVSGKRPEQVLHIVGCRFHYDSIRKKK